MHATPSCTACVISAQLVVPPVLSCDCVMAELDVPEVIGRECVAMTRLQRQAADAFSVLETAQANMVSNRPYCCP